MSAIRILHTADLHLGTPFRGIGEHLPEELASQLVRAAYGVLQRIVDVAIEHKVHVLTIAGDLFDEADAPVSVQYEVRKQFERLQAAGIFAVVTFGNHDAGLTHGLFAWPDNVFVLGGHQETDKPDVTNVVLTIAGKCVQFSGFSYLASELYGSQVDKFQRDMSTDTAVALYHGQVGAASGRHAPYAQTSVQEMLSHGGFEIWALGHVHKHKVLHDVSPLIVYPGAPQGRDSSEQGVHGAVLITVRDNEISHKLIPTSSVEWHKLTVDATGCTDISQVISVLTKQCEEAERDVLQLLDIEFTGQTSLYRALAEDETASVMQQALTDWGIDSFVYRCQSRCVPEVDIDALSQSDSYLGHLLRMLSEMQEDPTMMMHELLTSCDEREREVIRLAIEDGPEAIFAIIREARQHVINAM